LCSRPVSAEDAEDSRGCSRRTRARNQNFFHRENSTKEKKSKNVWKNRLGEPLLSSASSAALSEQDEDGTAALPHERATLHQPRLVATKASNSAAKPTLGEQDATLATLTFGKSHEKDSTWEIPGNKGSKGSNSSFDDIYPVEMEGHRDATRQNARGSTFHGSEGAPMPMEACPQCHCTSLLVVGAYRKCPLCSWKGRSPRPGKDGVLL
jgi:hypothetical protein